MMPFELKKDKELRFVMSRIRFLKKEIVKSEKVLKALNTSTVEYNDGKTIGQNPEIKTYNDHIKNINSLYSTLLKLNDGNESKDINEVAGFIRDRNPRK